MNLGLGIQIGRPPPHIVFTWDFTQQSPGALVLPTGLTFARASSGHTVQTGDSTIVTTGITSSDVGRIGRLATAHSYGVFIEPARQNLVLDARDMGAASWSTASAVAPSLNYATGPDGASTGDRTSVSAGQFSRYRTFSGFSTSSVYSFSAWQRATSGTATAGLSLAENVNNGTIVTASLTTAWQRVSGSRTPLIVAPLLVPVDGSDRSGAGWGSGPTATARDVVSDLHQVELGKYPTSAILTTGSAATRAAERLTIDSTRASQATVNGRLGFYVRFRAIAALTEMDGSAEGQILLGVGSTCYVWISPTSRYILLGDGGSKYSQTANSVISWARGDLVEMVMELGNGVSSFRWRINGGSVNTASFTARNDVLDPIVPSSGLDVLCAGTSWHTPAVLERATLFVPGRGPF